MAKYRTNLPQLYGDKATNDTPVYYMVNCAHPTHFEGALAPGNLGHKEFAAFEQMLQPRVMPNLTGPRNLMTATL